MSECSGNCSSCSENCSSREQQDLHIPQNEYSNVGKVIAVISGKGGVGKSTAVLDADVTGPSIPQAFGIHKHAEADAAGLLPEVTKTGIRIMSVNLLLESEDQPVVWRGPVISGVIQQFWKDVAWGDVDYMFVDMPPGTGDVPLTVFQSLPVDGVVIVTSPQDLVSMIVAKAVNMAKMMDVPIIGVAENMSYLKCPDCGKEIEVFGSSKVTETAKQFEIPHTARIPIDPAFAAMVDAGEVESISCDALSEIADAVEKIEVAE